MVPLLDPEGLVWWDLLLRAVLGWTKAWPFAQGPALPTA